MWKQLQRQACRQKAWNTVVSVYRMKGVNTFFCSYWVLFQQEPAYCCQGLGSAGIFAEPPSACAGLSWNRFWGRFAEQPALPRGAAGTSRGADGSSPQAALCCWAGKPCGEIPTGWFLAPGYCTLLESPKFCKFLLLQNISLTPWLPLTSRQDKVQLRESFREKRCGVKILSFP